MVGVAHSLGLPWWNWGLQGMGMVCAYIGAEANSRLDVRGFYLWLVANVALFAVHALSGLWLLCVLDVAYCNLNLRAIARWKGEVRRFRLPRPGRS